MTDIRLPLEPGLLAKVDEARGDIPRVRWIRRLIEEHFETPAVSHPMDSPDRSARGDGGWSTKVERQPVFQITEHEFKPISAADYHCEHCGGRKRDHT